jgi:phospholipid-translocating ATPase
MGKEALDDYQRYLRDKESNSTRYLILDRSVSGDAEDGLLTRSVSSSKLKVGDMVVLEKNDRIPADMVLLRTSEGPSGAGETGKDASDLLSLENGVDASQAESALEPPGPEGDDGGACFVRTDQLDGETDWKLRIAVGITQSMTDSQLVGMKGSLYGELQRTTSSEILSHLPGPSSGSASQGYSYVYRQFHDRDIRHGSEPKDRRSAFCG